jgi:hypothetical protein
MIMRRNSIVNTFAIAITGLALGMAPAAKADDKGCSNATLQGTFAFTSTGFITAPPAFAGPVGEVGTQTFDGRGGTTGAATLSQNGNIVPVTLTGTYTVNPDCTGTFTVQVAPGGFPLNVFFVIADNGSEFHGIETATGFVITRIARKLSPGRNI